MKRQGLTYRELARLWNLSESSVKRIMSQEDLSLERIIALADRLGLALPELFQLSFLDENEPHSLSAEQDAFLASHPLAAYLYLRVLIREPLDDFAKAHGIPRPKLVQQLLKLEKIGLLEVLPGDRVRVRLKGPYRWQENGAMIRAYLRPFVESVYRNLVTESALRRYPDEESTDFLVRPFELYLTSSSLKELVSDLREVVNKFRKRTNTEVSVEKFASLKPVSGLLVAGLHDGWRSVMMRNPK